MAKSNRVPGLRAPLHIRLMWLGLAAGIAAGGYLLYELGRFQAGYHRIAVAEQRSELKDRIAELERIRRDLRAQLTRIETSRAIDREAYAQVEANLAELQSQILEQQEDLAFYRGIVSPADGASGLRIQKFEVFRRSEGSLYRLRLVLVQAMKHDRRASGVVHVSIEGAREGEPVTYALADLSPDGTDQLAYSFRYFQDFDHDVVLPTGFVPHRVNVEVSPRGRPARTIRESFDWDVKSS